MMNPTIKARIESIRRGEVPAGYKRTKIGIVPNEWGNVLFSTLFESFSVYTEDLEKYPLYSLTIEEGITPKTERYERSFLVKKKNAYKVMRPNDFAYNPMNLRFGAVARYKGEKLISVSGYYDIFTTKSKLDLEFMDNFLIFDNMITYYNKVSIGSLIEKQRVHFSNFLNFELPLPPPTERNRIAEILAGQDRVIALKEKLLAEKQKQKKYLMQQLLTGKKRLPGFSGEWKCVRLGELGCFYSGLSGKTKEDFGSGKPYIPYKNIFNNPKIDCDFFEYVKIKENEKQTKVRYGDIFFTTSSEILSEVGMTSVMLDSVEELYLNSFCTGFRLYDFNLIHPEYASHYFRGEEFRIALNKISQGITRFNLSKNGLSKISLTLPSIEEQLAIAQILSTVDKEIELLKKDIEQEKLKKKSLMQLLLTGIVRVDELVS